MSHKNTATQRNRRQGRNTNRRDRVVSTRNQMDRHIKELIEAMRQGKSEQLIAYLDFASRFHRYSVSNQILIWTQRPTATWVAGLRRWNELGRRVKPGERGIMIFAPIHYRKDKVTRQHDEDGGGEPEETTEELVVKTFRPVFVFDVSQTEGRPIPKLQHAKGDTEQILPALRSFIESRQIELVETCNDSKHLLPPGAEGISAGGRIVVDGSLPQAEMFRVVSHELAHEILHHDSQERPDRRSRETEADAAAFITCKHFGLECDASDYLLLYDSSTEVLMSRLESIRRASSAIIEGIESELEPHHEPATQAAEVVSAGSC